MDSELLKRAVEYADGFDETDSGKGFGLSIEKLNGETWVWCFGTYEEPADFILDALAAQLERQLLQMGLDIDTEIQGSHFEAPGMWICIHDPIKSERTRFEKDVRFGVAENRINAIVQFFDSQTKEET